MKLLSTKRNADNNTIEIFGIKIELKKHYIFEKIFCNIVKNFCKVKNNKILIVNMMNWQYACNLKYIADEIITRNKDFDFVWLFNKETDKSLIPKNFRLVKYNSFAALYEFLTARVWISNAHMFLPFKKGVIKSKETIFFQTYHGSMGIKKIDADAKTFDNLGWHKWQKISSSFIDYAFTDSECEKQIFKSAFWGYGEILKLGKARDSIFYKDQNEIIKKVKDFYNIPNENKICMYAPTWRSDKRCNCYNIDINYLKKNLHKRFGGNWSVLIRAHKHMKNDIFNALYNKDEVIDCTHYIDMQELLVAADVLISDYSSCIPEYTILKKPSFIYATDIEKYENGFYYSLDTLPSPVATDNGELAENILNFDENKFNQKVEEFLVKMGHKDDENSCKRIVDFILEKMEEK